MVKSEQVVVIIGGGGLHIEQAGLTTIGDLLKGSGWTALLDEAKMENPGIAKKSLLHTSRIAKACHAHKVTVAALNIILKRACEAYKEDLAEDDEV